MEDRGRRSIYKAERKHCDAGKVRSNQNIWQPAILLLSLGSALLVVPGPLHKGRAQSAQARGLPSIHWPDVSKLEPEVRDQLTGLEKSLTAAINKPDTTDAALAESLGAAGKIYHAYSLTLPARECYLNAALLAPNDFCRAHLTAQLHQQDGRMEDDIL